MRTYSKDDIVTIDGRSWRCLGPARRVPGSSAPAWSFESADGMMDSWSERPRLRRIVTDQHEIDRMNA